MIKFSYGIILPTILVLLCTAFIFSNSLKSIEASRSDSDVIVEIVEKIGEKVKPNNGITWGHIVRNGAHIAEFFILGMLTSFLWLQTHTTNKSAVALVFLYVTTVAFTDEFIQKFTGRGSELKDVGRDVCGAYIGIALVLLIGCMFKLIKRKTQQRKIQNDSRN